MSINYADAAVVLILLVCMLRARRKDITYFAVSVVGKIISLILSVTLYGRVSSLLRQTPAFPYIKEKVGGVVDAEAAPYIAGFSEHLMANDNSEIYKLFSVDTFSDYVSSYITNIALNISAVIIVYVCVSVVIGLLFRTNAFFSGLPVMKQLNTVTGLLAGFIEGVILIWIAVIVLIFFALQGRFVTIYETLLASSFAIYFLKYNIFALAIFKVTP